VPARRALELSTGVERHPQRPAAPGPGWWHRTGRRAGPGHCGNTVPSSEGLAHPTRRAGPNSALLNLICW